MPTNAQSPRQLDVCRIKVLDPSVAAILRKMPVADKVEMIQRLNRIVRQRLTERIRAEHQDWTADDIAAEVAHKLLDGNVNDLWASDMEGWFDGLPVIEGPTSPAQC